jgi:DNA-binding beta-propeller fold protein YncE
MLRFRSPRAAVLGAATLSLTVLGSLTFGAMTPAGADHRPQRPSTIDLPTGWRPEGVTAGRKNDLYVGSLANGAIYKANARTGEGAILTPGATGRVSVGVDFDKRTNRLWVAGGGTQEVRVVDATSGEILRTYPTPGAQFINDVVATRDAVYFTDSRRSVLIVIPTPTRDLPASDAARELPLTSTASGNGIVSIKGWLVIVQGGTVGTLFRVNPATGEALPIDLGGYSVTNGDGLEPGKDGGLFVVRNRSNLIAQLKLSDDLLSGRLIAELTNPNFDVPTTAALQGGKLWAVNARFGIPDPATASYAINAVKPVQTVNDDHDDDGDDRDDDRNDDRD